MSTLDKGPAAGSSAGDGLRRRAPSDVKVNADALVDLLADVEAAGLELHAIMLWRDDAVVLERWKWPYGPGRLRMTHSVTKSFTACAIGLLIEAGQLSLSDPVIKFFPGKQVADPRAAQITVEDLLTMRTGHGEEVSGSIWRGIATSWIDEFFRIPIVHEPGTVHVYSSAASYMLSAIVTAVTGETIHRYLKPRLFEPLGITGETWDIGPDGINSGGNGLSLTTADALKLGVLHAQGGVWAGRRVLPESWVAAATRPQGSSDYGYHWVIGDNYYAALGVFVQAVIVFPQANAVVAVNAAMTESAVLLPHLKRRLPLAFAGPGDPAADARLAQALAAWPHEPVFASEGQRDDTRLAPGRWTVEANPLGVAALACRSESNALILTLEDAAGAHSLAAAWDGWREGVATLPAPGLHHGYPLIGAPVVAGARWVAPDELEVVVHFTETAFRDTLRLRFAGLRVTLERSVNINSGARAWPTLTATA